LRDTSTKWSDLEPAQGRFAWANLDKRIALAEQHGVDLVLTFGDEAAFLAHYYLLQYGHHVSRFYWYAYDNTSYGTLWNASDGLLQPGMAYGEVYKWMVGAAQTTACSARGNHFWTCDFTRAGGYRARAVWSSSGTAPYAAPGIFTQNSNLEGCVTPISRGETLQIGSKPVPFETTDIH